MTATIMVVVFLDLCEIIIIFVKIIAPKSIGSNTKVLWRCLNNLTI